MYRESNFYDKNWVEILKLYDPFKIYCIENWILILMFVNETSDKRYTLLTNVFYSAKWVYLTKCNLSRYNMYPVVYNRVHTYAPGRNGRVHMCTKSYTTEYTCVPYRVRQNTHVYEEVDTCSQMYKNGYIHVCTTGYTCVLVS